MPGSLLKTHHALIALCCQPDLARGDVAVLALLLEHHNTKTGRCDPGRKRLSNLAGLSMTGVTNSLTKLENLGWIDRLRHGGKGRTNAYVLNFDKLNRLASDFEVEWDRQADLIDSAADRQADLIDSAADRQADLTDKPADGQAHLTTTVKPTCRIQSSTLDTNPLSNPLNEPAHRALDNNSNYESAPPSDTEHVVAEQIETVRRRTVESVQPRRKLTKRELATLRWRAEVMEFTFKDGGFPIDRDSLPAEVAEQATVAELGRKGAGVVAVLNHIASLKSGAPAAA